MSSSYKALCVSCKRLSKSAVYDAAAADGAGDRDAYGTERDWQWLIAVGL